MKAKLLFHPVLISLVLLSCEQTKVDVETEKAAVMKVDSAWAASASEGKDVEKIVSYWADDAVVIPPGEAPVKGKEALRKMVAGMKSMPGFSISWKSSDVQISSDGKMAYMYGENLFTLNDSTGKRIAIPGRGYTVWRKEADGNWKCVADIWNNPPAGK